MIFIVTTVFNRKTFTLNLLLSLRKQNFKTFKIIVVDHGSTDGTREMILENFPEVLLVLGNAKMWWTAATNLGIKEAIRLSNNDDNDFILTLNNDLEVEPDYLLSLLETFNNEKPCIVGSTSVDIKDPEFISFMGVNWNSTTAKYTQNPYLKNKFSDIKEKHNSFPSDLLPGRGTLIPIKAIKELGFYDELNFPHYAADEDFSLRCRKAGFKLVVSVKACVKSHINETGINNAGKKPSKLQFIRSLNKIKSPNNLNKRWIWAKRHGRFPIIYYILDVSRILYSNLK